MDCDDSDANVHPTATEVCDDKDNDCSGQTDEGCDNDHDGWCDANMTVVSGCSTCHNGVGDCDDENADVYPGAYEVPNNTIDENCDGKAEQEALLTCYLRHPDGEAHEYRILGYDADFDSYEPVQWGEWLGNIADWDDVYKAKFTVRIDDGNLFVFNAAADPVTLDANKDEFWAFSAITTKPAPYNPNCNPNAQEIPGNGIDEDCTGRDAIMQMSVSCEVVVDGVKSFTARPFPFQNGSGYYNIGVFAEPSPTFGSATDPDGDGATGSSDCNQNDPEVYSGATEIWGDGIDQNCNGKDPYSRLVITMCGVDQYVHPKPQLWNLTYWGPLSMTWNGSCFETASLVAYYAPREFYIQWGNPPEWDNGYWSGVCHNLTDVTARGYGLNQSSPTTVPVTLSKVPGQNTCHRYISESQLAGQ
ncbi:MAG: putative metal-binding motif-containing protein [Patescibacteria group bacterium]